MMESIALSLRFAGSVAATVLALAGAVPAAEVHVMSSGAFTAPYRELVPQFEAATGHKVVSAYGASQGGAPDSIPSRLDRGEPADVVILAGPALDGLIQKGQVVAGSRVDLVRSTIGMVVRKGAPRPDISTVEALRRTLLGARSIAYSASASGTYLSAEMFPRLGVAEQIRGKTQRIVSERVGTVVARGDAEIGFQQVSELLPIPGVDYVGPLPPEVQQVTFFSAGIAAGAKEPEAATELVRFFTSPAADPVISKFGLEPARAR
jgi:molybdate transport system substrate-binding protein